MATLQQMLAEEWRMGTVKTRSPEEDGYYWHIEQRVEGGRRVDNLFAHGSRFTERLLEIGDVVWYKIGEDNEGMPMATLVEGGLGRLRDDRTGKAKGNKGGGGGGDGKG